MSVAELSGVMSGLVPYSGPTHDGVRRAALAKIHEKLTAKSIAVAKKLNCSATILWVASLFLASVQIAIAVQFLQSR